MKIRRTGERGGLPHFFFGFAGKTHHKETGGDHPALREQPDRLLRLLKSHVLANGLLNALARRLDGDPDLVGPGADHPVDDLLVEHVGAQPVGKRQRHVPSPLDDTAEDGDRAVFAQVKDIVHELDFPDTVAVVQKRQLVDHVFRTAKTKLLAENNVAIRALIRATTARKDRKIFFMAIDLPDARQNAEIVEVDHVIGGVGKGVEILNDRSGRIDDRTVTVLVRNAGDVKAIAAGRQRPNERGEGFFAFARDGVGDVRSLQGMVGLTRRVSAPGHLRRARSGFRETFGQTPDGGPLNGQGGKADDVGFKVARDIGDRRVIQLHRRDIGQTHVNIRVAAKRGRDV
ncbi:MAG: hypothetical protein M5R36_02995 [Deltaproteobacteria bacterium]|nr:hypothetical protein [Deltaproteobacteria bacterium]